ncbi:MAG: transcription termination factor NusA [Bacillota bacterium]
MSFEFMSALDELHKQYGVDRETLLEAIESAVKSAYRRNYGSDQDVEVTLDRDSGGIKISAFKEVVEEVEDSDSEISVEEAREMDSSYEVGDRVEFEVAPERFARIAAQTAKQVITQRVREAERERIYDSFIEKEGDMITGLVQRVHHGAVFVDLGTVEAVLEPSEQIPGERVREGDRIKLYIAEVSKTTKGPQIILSRSHPQLIKRLMELEVPEVHDGDVEIVDIVREAGARSKVAVRSSDPNVDPVGACVGQRGIRIQNVVREIRGEKVDIVRWSPIEEEYVANSLSPAKVARVHLNEETRVARVVVPDDQLSLAIGKAGQNARLAARLTGWKIDIESLSEARERGEEESGAQVRTGRGDVRVPEFFLRNDEDSEDRPSTLIDRLSGEARKREEEDGASSIFAEGTGVSDDESEEPEPDEEAEEPEEPKEPVEDENGEEDEDTRS